jgi:hypothetical protein
MLLVADVAEPRRQGAKMKPTRTARPAAQRRSSGYTSTPALAVWQSTSYAMVVSGVPGRVQS